MKINILPEAQEDIVDAYWFYENQDEELGRYFITSVMKDIDRLEFSAGGHAVYFGKHRMVASKFPYSIFYLIESNEVNVYAVIDQRRDPEWINDRLN